MGEADSLWAINPEYERKIRGMGEYLLSLQIPDMGEYPHSLKIPDMGEYPYSLKIPDMANTRIP